jgi:ferredoxin--NADP+ reductase
MSNTCSARLIERKDVSESLAVFRFSVSEPLPFTAGQYATLGIIDDAGLLERPYSIASSPEEHFLEFFIELLPAGTFTPKLWALESGSTILIRRRVAGRLTLDHSVKNHVMIATVTGVAPFLSILRTTQFKREEQSVPPDRFLLIHSACTSSDFGPYLSELKELSASTSLTYIPTISRPWAEPAWQGETGRAEDVVRKYTDSLSFDHTNSVVYLCGHPGMVKNVKGIVERARFEEDQIRLEDYFTMPRGPHLSQAQPECPTVP